MLDASELPPTYGIDPSTSCACSWPAASARIFSAVEGAEDDEEAAIEAVNREVKAEDAVVGIAASGTTPYTVAAVRSANMLGALTVGVTNVAGSPLAQQVDIPIVVETGPEVIMGSTRMKSGTAQKLVLNTALHRRDDPPRPRLLEPDDRHAGHEREAAQPRRAHGGAGGGRHAVRWPCRPSAMRTAT